MSEITLNAAQKLFFEKHADGVTCLGFDVVFKRLCQYAEKLGRAMPSPEEKGTLAQFRDYRETERAYIKTAPSETLFDPDTPLQVRVLLEACRKHGNRIRLIYGDPESGRSWLEEHDVIGTVSRSMGPLRVPLLICQKSSLGGSVIQSDRILRIIDVRSKKDLYRHPAYQEPALSVVPCHEAGFVSAVVEEGAVIARFKSEKTAFHWLAFMKGERMQPH